MPHLRLPTVDLVDSFAEAMSEFAEEGRGAPGDDTAIGRDLREHAWRTDFGSYVDQLLADRDAATVRPGWVPCTTWWWCAGERYLGRIALRHTLNDALRVRGGHIGYDVRPTARRQGHATAMLGAVLPYAAALGIDPAMVTADDTNTASHGVIRRHGGVITGQVGVNVHFAVPTRPTSSDNQLHA